MPMTDPIADMLTRIRNAQMIGQVEVKMPASKLKAAIAHVLKDEGYIEDFALREDGPMQELRIGRRQPARCAAALTDAAHVRAAGKDRDHVGAGAADLVLDGALRAGAEGDHDDHRADANDDPEHRQRGAELVPVERPEGDVDGHQDRKSVV